MTQASRIETFWAMHSSGCFLLPNPWDVGSAVFLEQLGFKALATTSAGMGFSRGLPDTVTAISRELVLAHLREAVAATKLPVNADFQSGYADDAEGVAASVALCVSTGVAGLSIEDASGDGAAPLYSLPVALERLKAARKAIDASGLRVVLTARCEAALVGLPDPNRIVMERLVAYADAGADCVFAPGVRAPAAIADIVKAVAPKPVNVLVSAPSPALSVPRLAEMGVRRVSVGSALARVAWGAFMRAAKSLIDTGSFESFADATPFATLNDLFEKRS
jgi:2-methylisocitrate lyase-like PEP mutase family enzyme